MKPMMLLMFNKIKNPPPYWTVTEAHHGVALALGTHTCRAIQQGCITYGMWHKHVPGTTTRLYNLRHVAQTRAGHYNTVV